MDDRDRPPSAAEGGAVPVPVPVARPAPGGAQPAFRAHAEAPRAPSSRRTPGQPPARPGEDVSVLFGLGFVQSRTGWRFGIDALLLARHVAVGPAALPAGLPDGRMIEVGTGCGIVAILASSWGFPGHVVAVERQSALADRARRNVAAAGMGDRITVVEADAAHLPDDGTRFERLVSNPPFHRRGSGRENPDPERRLARHESSLDMDGLFALAADRLAPDGVASFLYPAARLGEAVDSARRAGLTVAGVTPCSHGPGRPVRVAIIDLARERDGPPIRHVALSMSRQAFVAPERARRTR